MLKDGVVYYVVLINHSIIGHKYPDGPLANEKSI